MTITLVGSPTTLDTLPAPARRALVGAPIGQQPLVEAALAWQRLQPVDDPSALLSHSGYLPIAETPDEHVATRVARLLSSLTFSAITEIGRGTAEARFRVDVPVMRHRPVTRTLAGVWRQTRRQFGPDVRVAGTDREAAISLWRIAALIAESEPVHHRFCFRPGKEATGAMLVTAAARLGVRATLRRLAYRPAVLIEEPDQVRLLVTTVLQQAPLPEQCR